MSEIIAPRKVKLYAPVSLRDIDFLTTPVVDDATGEDYQGNYIDDGGLAYNLVDTKAHRFLSAFDNKIINPQFRTDTSWTKGTGWTINAGRPGVAVFDGVGGAANLGQTGVVSSSTEYAVIVKCSEHDTGTFTPKLGTATDGTITGVGVTVHFITANGTTFDLGGPAFGAAGFEYIYILDSNDYRLALELGSNKEYDSAILDGHNLLDSMPSAISRALSLYSNTVDGFGSSTEVVVNELVAGLLGRGRPFNRYNGIDAYTNIDDDDVLSFGNGETDIPFSIHIPDINIKDYSGIEGVISKGSIEGATNREYFIRTFTDSVLQFRIYDQSAAAWIAVATADVSEYADEKINIDVDYDGSGLNTGMFIYINGVDASSGRTSSGVYVAMENLAADVYFGRQTSKYLECDIPEVIFYNRSRAPKEIEQMALGVPVPNPLIISDNSSMNSIGDYVSSNSATITGGYDSGDPGYETTLRVEAAFGTNSAAQLSGLDLPVGHRIRVEFEYKHVNSTSMPDPTGLIRIQDAGGTNSDILTGAISSTWASFDQAITIDGAARTLIKLFANQSAGDSANETLFKNIYLTDLDALVTFPLEVDKRGKGSPISVWTNNDFVVFVSSGLDITTAISNGAGDNCYSAMVLALGDENVVEFDLVINSGDGNSVYLRTASDDALNSDATLYQCVGGTGHYKFTLDPAVATDTFIGFWTSAVVEFEVSNYIMGVPGAVAVYQSDGISKEQGMIFDGSENGLHGTMNNVESIDAPDVNNLGYALMKFDPISNNKYWYLSVNEDNELPVGIQKFGQWLLYKSYTFDISALEPFGGAVGFPGVDISETDAGIFNANKRYKNRDRFVLPLAGDNRASWLEKQEFMFVIGGVEYPFYMELLPLNSQDESIYYRLRSLKKEFEFEYQFQSVDEPWFAGFEVVVDL